MIKLVIFDFDGTLADSKEVSTNIYNRLAEKYSTNKIANIENIRHLALLDRLKALDIPIYKIPLFAADFTRQYKNLLPNISLVSGMREVLRELSKRGYQLAIVSSNSENNIREFFRENKLDVIGCIVNSKNIFSKDKAVKKLLSSSKLDPCEVIYVGDEIKDIVTCRRLGIKIIWVKWGYDILDMINDGQPDYIVSSPEDILSILV